MRLLAKIGVFPFAYTFSYEHKDPDGRDIKYEDEPDVFGERARVRVNNLQLRWHLMALMNTDQFVGWPTENVEIIVEDVACAGEAAYYSGKDLAKGCAQRPRLEAGVPGANAGAPSANAGAPSANVGASPPSAKKTGAGASGS
jgi:hypothetical protein